MKKKLIVIAVGGNSLIIGDNKGVNDQMDAIRETCRHIAGLISLGHTVIITHGNGPQVGFIMHRSDLAWEVEKMHRVPLENCVADTQGSIGYQFQQALSNELALRGIAGEAVTVITQVEVDANDPGFSNPTKPIGDFMTEETAKELMEQNPSLVIREDSGRGWRQLVASPKPQTIVELDVIRELVNKGKNVIAVGGGGIPVVRKGKSLEGAAAVIDKDAASALLAQNVKADAFIVSTAVDKVCLNFGKPDQKVLDNVTVSELETYAKEGHFAPGSMLPKVNAVMEFLKNGGEEAIITSPERITEAVQGTNGTIIKP